MKMTANEIKRDFLLIELSISDKNSFDIKTFKRISDALELIDDEQLEYEYEKGGIDSINNIVTLKLEEIVDEIDISLKEIDISEGSTINDIAKIVLHELKKLKRKE